ncbi:hypothetical protein Vadar_027489 [Vaccinium darrowii]|uniref:Uncharacterized protein n=1 Tax=Vaccinium darrowii TaxID=229202 RepID=A0ACB7Y1Z8_9ERIC|nr:hypothetical protein Vadar_027489 [Vaccinium darrowii]
MCSAAALVEFVENGLDLIVVNYTEVRTATGTPVELSGKVEEIGCRLTRYAVGLCPIGRELFVAEVGNKGINPSGAERPDTHHWRRGFKTWSVDFAEVDYSVAGEGNGLLGDDVSVGQRACLQVGLRAGIFIHCFSSGGRFGFGYGYQAQS